MKIKKVLATAGVALVLLPAITFAQTTDTQSQVQALLSQIRALQQQLQTLLAKSHGNANNGGGMPQMMNFQNQPNLNLLADMRVGTVSEINDSSFVLKNNDGTESITVVVTSSTTIYVGSGNTMPVTWSTGSMSDIVVGKIAGVQGEKNADGTSITATMIKVGVPKMQPMMPKQVDGNATNPMNVGQTGKMMCVTLTRNLSVGSQGDDVRNLQQLLANDPNSGFVGQPTGYFGPMTAKAMMKWQQSNGITPGSNGQVGPLTRGLLQRKCGYGLGNGGSGEQGGGVQMGTQKIEDVIGIITANDGSTFTVQRRENSMSVKVHVVASTTITVVGTSTPVHAGTISDLTVGQTVMLQGHMQSDGSVDAIFVRVGTVPLTPFDGGGPGINRAPGGFMRPTNYVPNGTPSGVPNVY